MIDTNGVIEELSADYIVVATGSRPRVPDFVTVDRERVLDHAVTRTRRPRSPSTPSSSARG